MNPFEVHPNAKTSAVPHHHSPPPERARHLNIEDTQSIDGLAVHLQSPSLKRRYWTTRYASRYRELSQMAHWAKPIEAYLHTHQCDALVEVFKQELHHFEQLTAMKKKLHQDEQKATLSGMEQSLFQQARRIGGAFMWLWDKARDRWNTADAQQTSPTALTPPARRALQRWLHQFTSMHKDNNQRMSPALVQDIYRLQNYL